MLPRELKNAVLNFTDPHTSAINGHRYKNPNLTDKIRRSVWLWVLKENWDGNLFLLPDPPESSSKHALTNFDLVHVQSRSMYDNLCKRLPEASEDNKVFEKIDRAVAKAVYFDVEIPEDIKTDMLKYHLRLLHIPMRQKWLDLLEGSIDRFPFARFNDCSVEGHVALYRYLNNEKLNQKGIRSGVFVDFGEVHKICALDASVRGGQEISKIMRRYSQYFRRDALKYVARRGDIESFEYVYDWIGNNRSNHAIDTAAEFGHLDMVKYLHNHNRSISTTRAIDKAAENGHTKIVLFLLDNTIAGFANDAVENAETDEIAQMLVDSMTEERRSSMLQEAITSEWTGPGIRALQKSISTN